jgi:hypothetical protein
MFLHSGKKPTLDLQKQLLIRAFLTKKASCKFAYCLYFPPVESKTKTKIVLGVLKTFSLLAYYDTHVGINQRRLKGVQIFTIFIVLQGCLKLKGGGGYFLE